MRVYLSRWVCLGVDANLERLEGECERAVAAGARWVVFPESFLHGYRRTVAPARVRARLAAISEAHAEVAFFFGSFTETRRNRMTVWRGGRELARYDKVHLFAPNDEERLWDAGDRYVAVDLAEMRVGLVNCNDLRFPEQARALRLQARVQALVVVGWWPWRRDGVWRTLLAARAIENGVWALGCAVAASEWPDETFAGAGCYVFDPHGEPVPTTDDRTFDLDPARVGSLLVDTLERARAIDTIEVAPARE